MYNDARTSTVNNPRTFSCSPSVRSSVSDLCQLQGALVRAWRGAARKVDGVRPFQKRAYERRTIGWLQSYWKECLWTDGLKPATTW